MTDPEISGLRSSGPSGSSGIFGTASFAPIGPAFRVSDSSRRADSESGLGFWIALTVADLHSAPRSSPLRHVGPPETYSEFCSDRTAVSTFFRGYSVGSQIRSRIPDISPRRRRTPRTGAEYQPSQHYGIPGHDIETSRRFLIWVMIITSATERSRPSIMDIIAASLPESWAEQILVRS